MLLFKKLFFGSKINSNDEKLTTCDIDKTTGSISTTASTQRRRKKKNSTTSAEVETVQVEESRSSSKAIEVAKRFLEYYNAQDNEKLSAILSSDCIFCFPNAEMLAEAFIEDANLMRKSFPDKKLSCDNIRLIEPGVVKFTDLQCSGTHTGAPYGFGPYPLIEATGRKVLNDPEDCMVYINETTGQMTKMVIKAKGRLTGPPGLYEQIGGLLF